MQKSVIFLVFYQFSAKNGLFRANLDLKSRRKIIICPAFFFDGHTKIFNRAVKFHPPPAKITQIKLKN